MLDDLDRFIDMIKPSETHIKGKLPFIWVFGAGAEFVKRIDNVNDKLNPSHKEFSLYAELNSNRAKFFQWCLYFYRENELTKNIKIPEHYPEWESYRSKYTNLVDFELDIIALSQGAIIFSESVGSYVEIGMLSCKTELHQSILIVSPSQYIDDECYSFFNLGAISKIRENKLGDIENIWGLESTITASIEDLNNEFKNISTHILDIVTTEYKKLFSIEDRSHISLLLLDLINLFPSRNKRFYLNALEKFNVYIKRNELDKILSLLKILDLIKERKSGNNEKLEISSDYYPCVEYKGKHKPFRRQDFKIELKGGNI